ncbi:hypothetical protein [Virgibacillus halodenitrificans]|nr:hypothetical protein [Virgibacillus halodenitrificans]
MAAERNYPPKNELIGSRAKLSAGEQDNLPENELLAGEQRSLP